MAKRDNTPQVILASTKARIEAENERKAYLISRQKADTQGKILTPDEIGGAWDFSRVLHTTLGGKARMITPEDLKTFSQKSRELGKKYKGGITPRQIIDHSDTSDRERANKQINTGVPISYKGGLIHFITNAGPDSDRTRHHVYVELLDYPASVAAGRPAPDMAKVMTAGKIRVECDCGRWRYWYRYMATVGNYNLINHETGFPKIKNPMLHGVACKHILRVMHLLITSPSVRTYAIKMIENGRKTLEARRKSMSTEDMKRMANAIGEEAQFIRTSKPGAAKRPPNKAERNLMAKAREKAKLKVSNKDVKSAARELKLNAQKLLSIGAINQQQYNAMMQAIK